MDRSSFRRRFALSMLLALGVSSSVAAAPDGALAPPRVGSREEARVELGRRLFFDPRVSRAGFRACADCHDPEHAFGDPEKRSVDDRGRTRRHSQTLLDSRFNPSAHWDGGFRRIADLVTARTTLTGRGRVSLGHELPAAGPRQTPAPEARGSDRAFADEGGRDDLARDPGAVAPPEPDRPEVGAVGAAPDGDGDEAPPPRDNCDPYRAPASEGGDPHDAAPSAPPASSSPPPAPTGPGAPPVTTPSNPSAAPSGEGTPPTAPPTAPVAPAAKVPPPADRPPSARRAPPSVPEDPLTPASSLPPEKEAFMDPDTLTGSLPYADQVLEAAGRYREAFVAAYGTPQVTVARIAECVEAYCHSLVSGPSAWDRFVAGDRAALSPAQQRGLELFRGRAGCASCHDAGGARAAFTDYQFHNTGVVWKGVAWKGIGGAGGPAADEAAVRAIVERDADAGVALLTGRPKDRRTFKTPTLRDVARRAPYMHDGSLSTLEAVVRHYMEGPKDPDASRRLAPVALTRTEVSDLVAFLHALTSDVRPGLAPVAWKARAATTRARVLDAAGKPLAGLEVLVRPAGDRLPGAAPHERAGVRLRTDDDGRVAWAPFRSTHAEVVLPDGLKPEGGSFVPDTCDATTLRVPVRGRMTMFVTLPPGVVAPAAIEAIHETSTVWPDRRWPRTVFRREVVQDVDGRAVALYAAPYRTDAPPRAAVVMPVKAWGLDRLRVVLEPGKDLRFDLTSR